MVFEVTPSMAVSSFIVCGLSLSFKAIVFIRSNLLFSCLVMIGFIWPPSLGIISKLGLEGVFSSIISA